MLDIISICLMFALPMLPPQSSISGWHVINGPPKLTEGDVYMPGRYPSEVWFWDSEVRVWRRHPNTPTAETPQQMTCDDFTYLMAVD